MDILDAGPDVNKQLRYHCVAMSEDGKMASGNPPTFGTGSSLAERAANDSGRTSRLEERIAAVKCGSEELQERTVDHEKGAT